MTDKTIDHRLAWLAGIIDGEGWIGLGMQTRVRRGRPYRCADWYIAVGNTNAAMLAEIMSISSLLGLRASMSRYYMDRRGGHKPLARFSVNRKADCRALLLAVMPYLVSKRPQAELMLRAITHRVPYKRDGSYLRTEDDPTFQAMVAEMRTMNRRGTAPVGG